MLKACRTFFDERGVIEVDCPALSGYPNLDANVESMQVDAGGRAPYYLHTSPEYAMKPLLAHGSGDIYYLGHVFRKGEWGPRHSPEFTMIEWYRVGMSFDGCMDETCALLRLFLGPLSQEIVSYTEAFKRYVGLDPWVDPLSDTCRDNGASAQITDSPRDVQLSFLMSRCIEPKLGQGRITLITDYPPHEAALSRTTSKGGRLVALRFEAYYQGVELANGYHELNDPQEILRRLTQEAARRPGPSPPITPHLTQNTLPDACGVSVGFDRALMLQEQAPTLAEVLANN
jgi:lysyl-tRNA synthetase class 2